MEREKGGALVCSALFFISFLHIAKTLDQNQFYPAFTKVLYLEFIQGSLMYINNEIQS